MAKALKIDIINDSYSQLRISGITVDPTPANVQLALDRLEGMAAEYEDRGMCGGYNFTDEPDPSDESGIPLKYRQAYSAPLTLRLVDFGKTIPPELMAQAFQASSFLSASTFQLRPTQHPRTMPLGSGNTRRTLQWRRYYPAIPQPPIECATIQMRVGDINDFSETWDEYLNDGETLDSYTVEVTTGLTMQTQSLATPIISYRIKADTEGFQAVEFTVLTSDGRVDVRTVNFEISE